MKWGISPLPDYIALKHSDEEKKFPLILFTPNTGSRIHSQFGNLKIIRQTTGKPVIRISPEDAEERNIKNGSTIKVFNLNGELTNKVEISNRIPKGLVVFPNGIWFSEGGGVNQLTTGQETDMGFGAAFHDNRVEIERAEQYA
jgi:anaerobic selenocysteine-containing dehydrogenase